MLNLKDYGSSSDEDGPVKSVALELPINVHELNKKFAVNAAPDVLPPVSFSKYFMIIT